MYSVFIVDDEVIVRDGIRNKIDWEKSGFTFAGEAGDGEIALSMIQDIKPDILITDIKMPFMDGLELSRMVKKLLPWTKIIILSGHDEFEYAKKAISIGIADYILKPFTSEELLVSMNRAVEDLDKQKQRFSDIKKMKESLESASLLAKEKLLSDIVLGVITGADAVRLAADMKVDLISRFYTVCISEIYPVGGKSSKLIEVKSRLLSIADNNPKSTVFFISPERAVFILKSVQLEQAEEDSYNLANAVEHEISAGTDSCVVTSIGMTVDRIAKINDSYNSAVQYLNQNRLIPNKNMIINTSDCSENGVTPSDLKETDPLVDRIRYADEGEIEQIVNQYLECIDEVREDFASTASYLLVDIIMSISKLAEDLGGDVKDIAPEILSRSFVSGAVSSKEIFTREVKRILSAVLAWRNSRIQGKYGNVILRAKKYIEENFANPDICLMSTAKAVNMSPNHFSSVFSQECGMTYIEYLTNVRIERAKKLLKNTAMRSSEIAYEIGFSDPHYFSFIFKKVSGCSPQEFRAKEK